VKVKVYDVSSHHMPKISSLVLQVKTFWAFEWMHMANVDPIAESHEYFTTFHHGLGLLLHDHGRNGYGLLKI
jgi:hypothetical protein